MNYYTFILSSITYALKGKKALENAGIKGNLIKSANLKELRGCGFGLKVSYTERERSEAILTSCGIRIIGSVEEKE